MLLEQGFRFRVFGVDVKVGIPVELMQKLANDLIAEAQRVYNTTEAREKIDFELGFEGMPQSWRVWTSAPLLPPREDSAQVDFAPNFG